MGRVHTHHLSKFSRSLPGLKGERIASSVLTNSEHLSLLGLTYYFEIDVTLANGASQWYRFVPPPTDRDVGVLTRTLSPDLTGVSYDLYAPTSDFTDTVGGELTKIPFKPDTTVTPTSTAVLMDDPGTVGAKYVTPIYIGKGGPNPTVRPGGTNSRELGLWVYPRGHVGFFARINNFSGSSNRVVFRFDFAEYDATLVP